MDRNLIARVKKLSQDLSDAQHKLDTDASLTDEDRDKLLALVEDLQDDIWDVQDQIEGEAEDEYAEKSAKGWG